MSWKAGFSYSQQFSSMASCKAVLLPPLAFHDCPHENCHPKRTLDCGDAAILPIVSRDHCQKNVWSWGAVPLASKWTSLDRLWIVCPVQHREHWAVLGLTSGDRQMQPNRKAYFHIVIPPVPANEDGHSQASPVRLVRSCSTGLCSVPEPVDLIEPIRQPY